MPRQRPDRPFRQPDPTTGGKTHRFAFRRLGRRGADSQTRANVWALDYALDLYSNFTYCLSDIAATGTLQQGRSVPAKDRPVPAALTPATLYDRWGRSMSRIPSVATRGSIVSARSAYYSTTARQLTATTREDRVNQRSFALYAQNQTYWLPWLRTQAGCVPTSPILRSTAIWPPTLGRPAITCSARNSRSLRAVECHRTLYQLGQGLSQQRCTRRDDHRRSANPGTAVDKVKPLVRTTGYELGLRSKPVEGWRTTLALWRLDLASELIFVGDAGITDITAVTPPGAGVEQSLVGEPLAVVRRRSCLVACALP